MVVSSRHLEKLTIIVHVPEAAVDKNCGIVFFQDDVRFSWKLADMEPESKTMQKQELAHDSFWFSIRTSDTTHIVASDFLGMNISHT